MKQCKHCDQPSPTETCDECSTSGIGYNMWKKRFDEKFTVEFNGRKILYYDFDRDRSLIEPEVIKDFIAEELEAGIRLIDKIEMEDDNTSMQQWKQYKRIRNSLRDFWELTNKK